MFGRIEKRGDVALLWINNPPVNAINRHVRAAIVENLDLLASDATVGAVVIACEGRTFMAGADIKEFQSKDRVSGPVFDYLGALRRFPKPLVAALHGTALGGGFEVALACDYRVALASAKVGLPEVKIGVLPGGGGTQLLPRLIGVEPALEMMLSGEAVPAPKARELGAVDKVVEVDLVEGAVALARTLVGRGLRRAAQTEIPASPSVEDMVAAARQRVALKMPNQNAPRRIIECVAAATNMPFFQGIEFEAGRFAQCLAHPQSKALQHIFFAERQLGKIPDMAEGLRGLPVEKAAVIGAGTMGGGIAMNFVNAGIAVILLETRQEALDRGMAVIRRNYEMSASKGRLAPQDVEHRMGLITPTLSYDDLCEADIIVEAVFESMEVKHTVFSQLDKVAKPSAILASNTSRLSIDRIADATSCPERVVGTHFFSPANVMKLCEVVRGPRTSPETLRTTIDLVKRLKKVGVVAGDTDGFIGNRMITGYIRQSNRLVLEGASPEQVDRALCSFGMAMGPFAMTDLAGLDVSHKSRQNYDADTLDQLAGEPLNRLFAAGRYGQKTGNGYYDYESGQRTGKPSPVVLDVIVRVAADYGIQRRAISDAEIVERCLLEMINIGCEVLREGTAYRASDIDLVYVYGYGFPAYRGGPMFWAEHEVGLPQALEKIRMYGKATGEQWLTPSPLLEQLVVEGNGFASIV